MLRTINIPNGPVKHQNALLAMKFTSFLSSDYFLVNFARHGQKKDRLLREETYFHTG